MTEESKTINRVRITTVVTVAFDDGSSSHFVDEQSYGTKLANVIATRPDVAAILAFLIRETAKALDHKVRNENATKGRGR